MSASSTSSQIDCSLKMLGRDFNHQMNHCLSNNPIYNAIGGEAACVALAAIEAVQIMHARCVARPGPVDCTPKGYWDAVIEEVDGKNKILKIGFGKVKSKLEEKAGVLSTEGILVGAGGCLVGGATGLVGGAMATPKFPYVGATFGAVVGCRQGIVMAEAGYGLWKVVVKTAEVYEVVEKAYNTLKQHNAACGVQPITSSSITPLPSGRPSFSSRIFVTNDAAKSLADLPQSPFIRTLAPNRTQKILEFRPPAERIHTLTPIRQPAPSAPCSSTDPAPTIINPATFSWIEMEDAAQKILDIAADLTGIAPGVAQAKELKQMLVTILSNPDNAPKILFDQAMKEPERIWQKIVNTPEEFIANGKALINDPTLMGALNTVGTIYAVIGLANELLPILTRVTAATLKNPLAAPVVITKEMSKLIVGKVIGVVKLTQGLLTNPAKTVEHLYKGVVKAPEKLCKNVKSFVGLGHNKRKRKRRAKKLEQRRLQAEQALRTETAHIKEEIIALFPSCYTTAKQQWVIPETKTAEAYFSEIINDWKNAVSQKRFQGNCAEFLRTIHRHLTEGQFLIAARLSPKAHSSQMEPPAIVALAIIDVAKDVLELACEIKAMERIIAEHHQNSLKYTGAITSATASLESLQSVLGNRSDQQIGEALAASKTKSQALALLDF